MKTSFKHIGIAFSFLAIAGLLGSLTHYHSESLECLNHVDEQHYVQNDNICPICTINQENFIPSENDFVVFLTSGEVLEQVKQIFISPVSAYLEPSRAPPSLI